MNPEQRNNKNNQIINCMKRFFLSMALIAAISATAETRVETFDPTEENNNKTYNTEAYTSVCQQASWTTLYGGVCKNQGKMGKNNYVAVVRGQRTSEDGYGYIESDSISGGIDSLAFTWNSNGDKNCDLDIRIFINEDSVGGIYHIDEYKDKAPFYTWSKGNLKREGKFVIRIKNYSPEPYEMNDAGTKQINKFRLVIDDLTWTTYTSGPVTPTAVADIATEPSIVDVYTMDGCLLRHNVSAETATQDLPNGAYIVNNKKVIIAR